MKPSSIFPFGNVLHYFKGLASISYSLDFVFFGF